MLHVHIITWCQKFINWQPEVVNYITARPSTQNGAEPAQADPANSQLAQI